MAKMLMFNPTNLFQQLVEDSDTPNIEKLSELGYIKNPQLVAMFHPGMNDHKMVMVQDKSTWENKGYFSEPTTIYHPEAGKKTVSGEEAKRLVSQGWYDSPAHFPSKAKIYLGKEVS